MTETTAQAELRERLARIVGSGGRDFMLGPRYEELTQLGRSKVDALMKVVGPRLSDQELRERSEAIVVPLVRTVYSGTPMERAEASLTAAHEILRLIADDRGEARGDD